jgi:hypothetical protein
MSWVATLGGAGLSDVARERHRLAARDLRRGHGGRSHGRAAELAAQLQAALCSSVSSSSPANTSPASAEAAVAAARAVRSYTTRRQPVEAERARRELYEHGAVGSLGRLLRHCSDDPAVVEAACAALQCLSFKSTDAARAFFEAASDGGVAAPRALAAVLSRRRGPDDEPLQHHQWRGAQLAAVRLAANLCADDLDAAAQLHTCRVVAPLLRLLVQPVEPTEGRGSGGSDIDSAAMREACASALTNLCWAPAACQGAVVREVGTEPQLVPTVLAMLRGAETTEAEAAAGLLWALLRVQSCPSLQPLRSELAARGAVQTCVHACMGGAAVPHGGGGGSSSERLRVLSGAVLTLLGVSPPNTSGGGAVLSSGYWRSRRGGPNRSTLPPPPGSSSPYSATSTAPPVSRAATGGGGGGVAAAAAARGGGRSPLLRVPPA